MGKENDNIEHYYNSYWSKRLNGAEDRPPPIRSSIPGKLIKYSQYGACLNLVPRNSKLVDIGCGEGNVTELYRINKGCETYGLELSDIAGEMARQRGVIVSKWNLNESPYPFEDLFCDVVTVVDVLEHVINPLWLLSEARRMLKQRGRLIVLVPNFARLGNRVRMMFKGDPLDILHWGGYGDGMEHLHWFTQPKLKSFIEQAGFKRVSFYPLGLPLGFIYGIIGRYNLAQLLIATGEK